MVMSAVKNEMMFLLYESVSDRGRRSGLSALCYVCVCGVVCDWDAFPIGHVAFLIRFDVKCFSLLTSNIKLAIHIPRIITVRLYTFEVYNLARTSSLLRIVSLWLVRLEHPGQILYLIFLGTLRTEIIRRGGGKKWLKFAMKIFLDAHSQTHIHIHIHIRVTSTSKYHISESIFRREIVKKKSR